MSNFSIMMWIITGLVGLIAAMIYVCNGEIQISVLLLIAGVLCFILSKLMSIDEKMGDTK